MRDSRSMRARAIDTQIEFLCRATGGNAAVMFALAAVPALAAVGAGLDYTVTRTEQAKLQNAVDAAALSLAPDGAKFTSAEVQSRAQALVAAGFGSAIASGLSVAASYDAAAYRVTVTATAEVPLRFMSLAGRPSAGIGRTAVAQAEQATTSETVTEVRKWPVCLMVTAPTSNHSLFASGKDNVNGSKIAINGCMLQVNTANWDAVETDKPSASIIGSNSEFCFHGGYIHKVKTHGTVTTTVNGITPNNVYGPPPADAKDVDTSGVWDSGCPVFADPLEGVASPLAGAACLSGAKAVTKTTTLTPGRYCGNVTITGGTVTLTPGFYQIDGVLSISGSGTVVKGEGVTLFLDGPAANLDMSGGTVSLTPAMDASAGRLAGVAIYVNNTTGKASCALKDGNPSGPGKSAAAACVNAISGGSLTYSGLAYFRYLAFWISGSAQVTGNGASLIAEYVATKDTASLSITGIDNAATAAQLSMMQNSQAGYTTTTTVTKTTQQTAKLVR